jgi:hypothetical protein
LLYKIEKEKIVKMSYHLRSFLRKHVSLKPVNLWNSTESLSNPDFTYKVVGFISNIINISYVEPTSEKTIIDDVKIANVFCSRIDGSTTCERRHALKLNMRLTELLLGKNIELHNVKYCENLYEADVFLLDEDMNTKNIADILLEENLVFKSKPEQW